MSPELPAAGHIGPVIPVGDLARARAFYEGALEMSGEGTTGGWVLHGQDGSVAYLLPDDPGAGTAAWPLASFRVDDVHETVRRWRSQGVEFARDVPFDLDDDGVSNGQEGMQVAWLRDPDGNMLTVFARDEVALAPSAGSNADTLLRANASVIVGDNDGFLEQCTDDTGWTFVGDRVLRGKSEVREWMVEAYRAAPPRLTVDRLISEGDTVVAIGEVTTTDDDGSDVTSAYCDVWRLRDGKLAELHAYVVGSDPPRP